MEENRDLEQGTQGGAPANTPETPVVSDAKAPAAPKAPDAPKQKEKDPRVKECQEALAAFPTLPEGYLIKRGIYFDKEVAESFLQEGEELTIVKRPSKK